MPLQIDEAGVCVEISIQSLVARAFKNGASKCRLILFKASQNVGRLLRRMRLVGA